MRKITFYCDRCGKMVDGLKYQLAVYWTSEEDLNLDPWELETGADLCRDCYKEIDDMVAFMVKNPTIHFDGGKQIVPKAANKQNNKSKLDLGKIAALHNAGWSVKNIASEMHCAEQTIRNHLDEAKKFLENKERLERALENDIQEDE